jgi:ubiquitin
VTGLTGETKNEQFDAKKLHLARNKSTKIDEPSALTN